ncbi:hypothetical protein [Edaphobacter aggregans]|uniref:hypothetical protein n=1 Tax=Edaphobacter aggregans TaxID=570835 RepID=UPI000550F4F1|nr:hypothetical protein [Edaphobacter aggregans]
MTEQATGADAAEGSTGILPPPRPQQVDWKMAIQCAIVVSLVAALLSVASARVPALSALSWLWTVSGSVIALGLYQWRRPQAWMDAGVGARIGMVVGLTLVVSIAVAMAGAGLVARYKLHTMGAFDTELRAQIDKAAAMNPQPAEVMRYVYSPEFRAGMMLAGFAMLAGFVMVLSTLGGAVGGMVRARRTA